MLLPMMGFLFLLIIAGVFAGVVCLLFRRLRSWALFVALPPILGGAFSFALCWGLAFSIERLLHSERWAGIGFFGGYAGGGLLGAGIGLLLALKVRPRGPHLTIGSSDREAASLLSQGGSR